MRSSARYRHHRRYKLKSDINVVPYIDVMLVLLIIFMVAVPVINANVDVNLPQSHAKALRDKKDPLIVSVAKDGQLFLTLSGSKKERIDEKTLKAKIGAFVRLNPQVSVLVAGDKDGNYGGVYRVLADLQQVGVAKVGLMSQPEQGMGTSDGRK